MKIAILDLSRADSVSLDAWLDDRECLVLSVRPLADVAGRAASVRQLTPYESVADEHLALFRPLFTAGQADAGPRLPGAVISAVATIDHVVYVASRAAYPLLRDLEELSEGRTIDGIELVTDAPRSGRFFQACRAFARSKGIKLRVVSASPKGDVPERISSAIEDCAERIHFGAPAALNSARAFLKRHAAGGRLWPRRDAGAEGSAAQRSDNLHAAMLIYHTKSWRYVLPLRTALLAAGHDVTLISTRVESDRVLRAAGVPFTTIPNSLPSLRFYKTVSEYFEKLPLDAADPVSQRLVAEGGALRRVVVALAVHASQIYRELGARLPAIFRRQKTNVVFGTDSGSVAGRCLYRTAEQMGIASVFLQHGALLVSHGVAEYFTASHKLVWGASSRDSLIKAGVGHPELIESIGSPFLEQHFATVAANAATDSDNDSSPGPVLIAFSVPGGFLDDSGFLQAAREVMHAARALPHVPFVIKPHPGDRSTVWEDLLAAGPAPNVSIQRGTDTYELLHRCRVLVTMFSTVGAEAIYLGKPVVSVDLEHARLETDYLAAGAAYVVDDPETLAPLLERLLSAAPGSDSLADARARFGQAFLHSEARPAAERITEYVERVVLGASNDPRGAAAVAPAL